MKLHAMHTLLPIEVQVALADVVANRRNGESYNPDRIKAIDAVRAWAIKKYPQFFYTKEEEHQHPIQMKLRQLYQQQHLALGES